MLELRPHGENHAVVNLLTAAHGRLAGFVYGGQGRRQQPKVQPGNLVNFTWTAKISGQLGTLQLELLHNPSAAVMHDMARLSAIQFLCPLLARALPEHHPYPRLFSICTEFLSHLHTPDWAAQYVILELRLLAELGYGLDFSKCAVSGERDVTQLAYVSPRTGRAATAKAAKGYEKNLLLLPRFVLSDHPPSPQDILAGLQLTGYFLEKSLTNHHQRHLWEFRQRLIAEFSPLQQVA